MVTIATVVDVGEGSTHLGVRWILIGQYPNGPLGGLAITLVLSVLGLAFAFPLGVVIALSRMSTLGWLRFPAAAVIYVVRGVPLLMFIFWVPSSFRC